MGGVGLGGGAPAGSVVALTLRHRTLPTLMQMTMRTMMRMTTMMVTMNSLLRSLKSLRTSTVVRRTRRRQSLLSALS